jgi:hypothetical protein
MWHSSLASHHHNQSITKHHNLKWHIKKKKKSHEQTMTSAVASDLRASLEKETYQARSRIVSQLGVKQAASERDALMATFAAAPADDWVATRAALDLALAAKSDAGVKLAIRTLHNAPGESTTKQKKILIFLTFPSQ